MVRSTSEAPRWDNLVVIAAAPRFRRARRTRGSAAPASYSTRHLVFNVAATTALTADDVSEDFNLDDVGGLNYVAVQGGLQIRF